MPKRYRHTEKYEAEILRMRSEEKTRRKIEESLGASKKQFKRFINRHNHCQNNIATGIVINKRDRSAEDIEVTKKDKLANLRYNLAHKDA